MLNSTEVMLKAQDKILDPFEVKIKMMRNRITLTLISKKLHVTHQAISLALFGKSPKLLIRVDDLVERTIRQNRAKS